MFAHPETETIRRAQDFEGLLARTIPILQFLSQRLCSTRASRIDASAPGGSIFITVQPLRHGERLIRIGHVTRQFWKICLLATHPKNPFPFTKCTPPSAGSKSKVLIRARVWGDVVWEWVVSEFERRHKLSRANLAISFGFWGTMP